jgi:hypothetical protein
MCAKDGLDTGLSKERKLQVRNDEVHDPKKRYPTPQKKTLDELEIEQIMKDQQEAQQEKYKKDEQQEFDELLQAH